MKELVPAVYTPVERAEIEEAPIFVERLLAGDFPAFVIAKSGPNLRKSLATTKIASLLRDAGYSGDVRESVDFTYKSCNILPTDLAGVPYLRGDEWAEVGVTALHSDRHRDDQAQQYSLNHTMAGRSDFRLHPGRLRPDQLDEQWDILDEQTGDLLWNSLIDPCLIDPSGHRALIEPNDLLIFDPLYVHLSRTLEAPRISEATFFESAA